MPGIIQSLQKSRTEEAVKAAFVKEFGLKFDNPIRADLYCPPVLFEFKYRVNLDIDKVRAKVLAQALYYVHQIRYQAINIPFPSSVCLADYNQAALFPVENMVDFIDGDYDWARAPSSPDPKLVDNILERNIPTVVYPLSTKNGVEEFRKALNLALQAKDLPLKRKITIKNFEDIYRAWKKEVAPFLSKEDELNIPWAFIQDACCRVTVNNESGVILFESTKRTAKVSPLAYNNFWSKFDRPPDYKAQTALLQASCKLSSMKRRRETGSFFTPEPFASLCHDYMEKALGENWREDYVLWDPCCGTGNLEAGLPHYNNLYMSTLEQAEVDYLNSEELFPGATVFQFDFLNDPLDKLPEGLKQAIKEDKVIFLMNPPYAEMGTSQKGENAKTGLSKTKANERLNLGVAGNELFVQFISQASFLSPRSTIGLFSTMKYLSSPNFKRIRESLKLKVDRGFLFSSKAFEGTKGNWGVLFSILEYSDKCELDLSRTFDVLNLRGEKIGEKVVASPEGRYISDWFSRPRCTEPSVPLSSALVVKEGKVRLDKIAPGSIGYCVLASNDPQHSNLSCITSSANWHSAGTSILPENFDKVLTSLGVRRLISRTWLNDRDQYTVPHTEPGDEFVSDCVVWTLFSGHNQTSSFTVEYKGENRFIKNHFYPYSKQLAQKEGPQSPGFQRPLERSEETFVHTWLQRELSTEAKAVLEAGEKIYRLFFKNWNNLRQDAWKIENATPGWYQIRNALQDIGVGEEELLEVKKAVNKLGEKLRPQVYELGFLEPEIIYEEIPEETGEEPEMELPEEEPTEHLVEASL